MSGLLNLAGPSYDFGTVLYAVLQECEHVRRSLLPNEAEARLLETARRKLSEIRQSYEECGGTPPYWQELEREVLETSMPQYSPRAIEQTRLEKTGYDVWRQGDPAARAAFALLGLILGGLIIAAPFIPIWEDAFAFALAAAGLLYPELKQLFFDTRHSRLLNRLIAQAEKYQHDSRIHYISESQIQEELGALETEKPEKEKKTEAGDRGLRVVPPPKERDRA